MFYKKLINIFKRNTYFSAIKLSFFALKLSFKECKIEFIILFSALIISGLSEVLLINSLIPIIKNFSNINYSESFQSINSVTLIPLFLFIFIISIATSSRIVCIYYGGKLSAKVGNFLGEKAFRKFTYQSYREHLDSSSSKFI